MTNGVETTVVQGGTRSHINERFDMGDPSFTRHQTGAGQRDQRKRQEYKNPKDAYMRSNLCIVVIYGFPGFPGRWLQVLLHKVTLSHINEEIVDMAALVIQPAHPITPHLPSGTPRNKMIVRKRESSCFPAGWSHPAKRRVDITNCSAGWDHQRDSPQ